MQGKVGGGWAGALQEQGLKVWAWDKVMARLIGSGSAEARLRDKVRGSLGENLRGRGSAGVRLRGLGRSSVGARLRGMSRGSIGAKLRGMGRGSAGVMLWGMGRGRAGARLRVMGRGNDAKTALRVMKETK